MNQTLLLMIQLLLTKPILSIKSLALYLTIASILNGTKKKDW